MATKTMTAEDLVNKGLIYCGDGTLRPAVIACEHVIRGSDHFTAVNCGTRPTPSTSNPHTCGALSAQRNICTFTATIVSENDSRFCS
jgi:hypothetical protein